MVKISSKYCEFCNKSLILNTVCMVFVELKLLIDVPLVCFPGTESTAGRLRTEPLKRGSFMAR